MKFSAISMAAPLPQLKKLLLVMKLTTLMLIIALVQASAKGYSQKITLHQQGASLASVLQTIKNQTGYVFISNNFDLENTKVSIDVKNASLDDALKSCFKDLPLNYKIIDKTVVIEQKEPTIFDRIVAIITAITVHGKIVDENGNPLPGATVMVKGTNNATIADSKGEFTLTGVDDKAELTITSIGYKPLTLKVTAEMGTIKLEVVVSSLDQVQVIGYGTTTKRFNTGSVSTIKAGDIEKQPVTNILSALSGQMAGVFIQSTNGLPGGNINVQIRGKGSLTAGTNPLYIIDGVPFESATFGTMGQISNAPVNGTVSPLNSLNPSDIESLTVLKDADATAIYGSRGSNGVVLITTKKGKAGLTKTDINITQGISTAADQPKLLNIDQYLQIRKEAFANDGLTPDINSAPDLLTWSQSQNTNWAKYAFGNTAAYTDIQSSISGGNENTSFSTSGNFHRETNIISDQSNYIRGGVHFNLSHTSSNKKFDLQISNSITLDGNNSPNLANAYSTITLPPNLPLITNGQSTLWFGNPAMDLSSTTKVQTNNVISSINLSYAFLNNLKFKLSGGYNKIDINQQLLFPLKSQFAPPNYSQFLQNTNQSITVEPQLNYTSKIGNGDLNVLAGGTYQYRTTNGQFFQISNFSNEELMDDFSSGATVDIRNNLYSQYKYVSLFGRANYNLLNKYVFNLTFRRDGSSRFGPGNQFGNFGSAGAAWLFSEENWLKNALPFLSFGKLRASYGSTGNDQIPDYNYLSTYKSSGRTIQDVGLIAPSRIANANFHWETTKKLEFGIELGIIKNKILLDVDYYRNRSSDQLVNYTLPTISGFTSYVANLPAVVQNTGWEFDLTTINIKKSDFSWTTKVNLTVPRNKLVSFQNFNTSAYAQLYQIGYDITRVHGYQFLGVDPQTGNAIYGDINGKPTENSSATNTNYTIGKTTPNYYGGVANTITYKQFSLDFLFQFTSQMAQGGILYSPGQLVNTYAYTINRWQKPGMNTNVPKSSTIGDYNYPSSSANFFNASYLRLKNVALSYNLPNVLTKKMKANHITFFLKGQNLLTFWNKNIPLIDPEAGALTASQYAIAPTKSLVAGLSFTF